MASKVIATTAVVVAGSAVFYLVSLHRSLSTKLHHTAGKGVLKRPEPRRTTVESLPVDIEDSSQFYVISDVVYKLVPVAKLPVYDDPSVLLTTYLRRNMAAFTSFPQAKLMRYIFKDPDQRKTFDASYIRTLDFVEGDVFCGAWVVKVRTPTKVEFGMVPMKDMAIDGRLVLAIEDEGEQKRFVTTSIQWKLATETFVLPMDRALFRWLHELGSLWLLETGTDYLCELRNASAPC